MGGLKVRGLSVNHRYTLECPAVYRKMNGAMFAPDRDVGARLGIPYSVYYVVHYMQTCPCYAVHV